MNDLEKSNVICKLCGWSIVEFMQYHDYRLMDANDNEIASFPDWYQTDGDMPDLYNPVNMALAWRVLNWRVSIRFFDNAMAEAEEKVTFNRLLLSTQDLTPEKAIREWMDAIYALAIQARLI